MNDREWRTPSVASEGVFAWDDLPEAVRAHATELMDKVEILERDAYSSEAAIFVDRPHGQMWRVSVSLDELDVWELEISRIAYRSYYAPVAMDV